MDYILGAVDLGKGIYRSSEKWFVQKIWTGRNTRLLFLFVLCLVYHAVFFQFQLTRNNNVINGFSISAKTSELAKDTENAKALQRQTVDLSKIT